MSKLARKIIYIIFVVLFLASIPLVLLYTAGYRYDFDRKRLLRTGVLFLDSEPAKADIFINGKKFKRQTPTHVGALLPGDYQIKVGKEGFLPWQKTLSIYSNQTTFATNITLPKDKNAEKIADLRAEEINLAPGGKTLLTLRRNENRLQIGLYDLENKKYADVLEIKTSKTPTQISWIDERKALVRLPDLKKFIIVNAGEPSKYLDLTAIFGANINRVIPDEFNAESVLVHAGDSLYRFALDNKGKKEFLEKTIYGDFQIQGGIIYFTRQNLQDFYLASRELVVKNDEAIKNLMPLNRADYQFLESPTGFILLRHGAKITLIKLSPEPRIILETAGLEARWFKNSTGWKLLYWNDFELFFLNPDTEKTELITRRGAPIGKARAYSSGEHIIFLAGERLLMTELDARGERNVWTLAEAKNIYDFVLSTKENTIYFTALEEGERGLYKRDIK